MLMMKFTSINLLMEAHIISNMISIKIIMTTFEGKVLKKNINKIK